MCPECSGTVGGHASVALHAQDTPTFSGQLGKAEGAERVIYTLARDNLAQWILLYKFFTPNAFVANENAFCRSKNFFGVP